jgi:hypothetical protein
MNKITAFLLIVITALSFVLGATMQSKAQDKTSFAGVVPFMTNSNRLGLFNQNNGQIYMYDENLSQCVFIGQVSGLGQPIQTLKS